MVTKNAVLIAKKSTTAGAVPAPASLQAAELAINMADRKLYSKDHTGAVFQILPSMSEIPGVIANTQLPGRLQATASTVLTDFNAAVENGKYLTTSTASNSPYNANWFLEVDSSVDGYVTQKAYRYNADSNGASLKFKRDRNPAGTWTAWGAVLETQAEMDARYVQQAGGQLTGALGLAGPGANYILPGTGDGATFDTYNFALSGWFGMGMRDSLTGLVNGCYDFRSGTWDVKGGYKVNGKSIFTNAAFEGPLTSHLGTLGGSQGSSLVGYQELLNDDNGDVLLHRATRFENGGSWEKVGRSIERRVDGTSIAEVHFGAPFIGPDAAYGMAFMTGGQLAGFFRNDGSMQFQKRPTYLGSPLATLAEVGSTVQAHLDLLDKRMPWVTPEMFGAVGDDAVDDAAAVNAMIASLPSTGGMVIWGAKTYRFDSDVVQDRPIHHIGVYSGGATGGGTRLLFAANARYVLKTFSGGSFSGINFIKGAEGQYLVYFADTQSNGVSYTGFDRCNFDGPCTITTVYITNVLKVSFFACRIRNSYNGAATKVVFMDGRYFVSGTTPPVPPVPRWKDNVDNVEFIQCVLSGTQNGLQDLCVIDGKADSTKFTQCALIYGRHGIVSDSTGPTVETPAFIYFNGGGFENGSGNAVRLVKGSMVNFANFYGSHDATSTLDLILTLSTFTGIGIFSAGMLRGAKRSGYRLEGGQITISGGKVANCSFAEVGIGYGVEILSTVSSIRVVGMDCTPYIGGTDRQNYAIRNSKGASGVIISACDLTISGGSRTGGIFGTATGPGISGNLT